MGVFRPLYNSLRILLTAGFLPPRWRIPCFAAAGVLFGIALFTAHISRAASYMSDDPETCTNCHVMFPQYVTWQHSSHREAANCNDCHVPHDGFLHHWTFKAQDGMRHSRIFTFRGEPQVIRMSAGAVPVVEANCRRCHAEVMAHVPDLVEGRHCWDCHRETPHGLGRSLSSTPRVMAPVLAPMPDGGGSRIGGRPPRRAQKNEE